MANNYQINININNQNSISPYINFNNETTFNDLLESIAYNFPQYDICPCFEFQYYNSCNYGWINIDKNSKVNQIIYNGYRYNITLNNINCKCSGILKNYFKKPKIDIINFLEEKINNLEEKKKINRNKENEINKLKNIKINYENENKTLKSSINELKNEIEKYKKELEKLNSIIDRLTEEKQLIEIALNEDVSKIRELKQLGITGKYLKPNKNIIKIDPKTNKIIGNKYNDQKINFVDFYDVIVNIKSIKDITKGWEIKMSKRAEEKYENIKKNNVIKIGVIGNANKGKSFLLSKISKIKLPYGTSISTEGLSIKYPEIDILHGNRYIALLDSAGLETPVLKEENENIENLKDFFKEKSREKIITELFLQNYIIYNSDILIIVVGILTYSEQKLLNKIKNELRRHKINKPLYIIHNLMTYTTKNQVEDYIKSFLLKSATFKLKEQPKISTGKDEISGKCFYEINDEQKNDAKKNDGSNNEQKIFHFIFANEGSEAGDYYNKLTLNFIEHTYQQIINIKPFDVIESIKKRFIDISKDIIQKTEKEDLKIDNFDTQNNKIIKLNITNGEIILKRCLIDELGFSNLKSNGFEPTYNFYIKDEKIIVKIEGAGNTSINNCPIELSGEYTILKINGIKKKDKEPAKIEDNIYNNREFGNFYIQIYLNSNDLKINEKEYIIKNEKPKIKDLKGEIILEYSLEERISGEGYIVKEEDEI